MLNLLRRIHPMMLKRKFFSPLFDLDFFFFFELDPSNSKHFSDSKQFLPSNGVLTLFLFPSLVMKLIHHAE